MTKMLLLTFTLLAACGPTVDEGVGVTAERSPLGKADLIGSCAGSDCDSQADGGTCWCDDLCVEFGDCCADRVAVCEAPVAPVCGGLLGTRCGEGFYCDFGDTAKCGLADQTGVCREIPSSCSEALLPVCGCNGETFDNSCLAAQAGVSVLVEGACE